MIPLKLQNLAPGKSASYSLPEKRNFWARLLHSGGSRLLPAKTNAPLVTAAATPADKDSASMSLKFRFIG
jgi:hypothetical protein